MGEHTWDLLLTEGEVGVEDDHVLTAAHVRTCDACRGELASAEQVEALLAQGVAELTEGLRPSAAFWSGVQAGLDGVEREREARHAPRGLQAALRTWRQHLLVLGLLGAGVGVAGAGGPQQAWAALRAWLYTVPFVGVGLGQVPATAWVASEPASATSGGMTLTVDGLLAERRATLVVYHLSGGSTGGARAPVADAVDAVLSGTSGHRYLPLYWQPTGGTRGLLALQPLEGGERSVRLLAARLPIAPAPTRPWAVTLALRPVSARGGETVPERGTTRHGVRLSVTQVNRIGEAVVIDLQSAVTGRDGTASQVISLSPEEAVGQFAPLLSTSAGDRLSPLPPLLTPLLRTLVLPLPEFVYLLGPGEGTPHDLAIGAVEVRHTGSVTVMARAQQAPRSVLMGGLAVTIAAVREVAPSAALGLEGTRRLQITLAFPPPRGEESLERIDSVVGGVRRTISRDDPRVELPLGAGQHAVTLTLRDAVTRVQGTWTLPLTAGGG